MRRRYSSTLLIVLLLIVGLLCIPLAKAEKARGVVIALAAPLWETVVQWKLFFQNGGQFSGGAENYQGIDEQVQRLQLENQLLSHELSRLQELYQEEHLLYSQLNESLTLMPASPSIKHLSERHSQQMQKLFDLQLQALPARVIYRSPGSWNNYLWVNVGSADNEGQERVIIAKNSPVLVGSSVVGVVDYVGKRQARVRLLTDVGMNPSVRALRGGAQNRLIAEQVETLIQALATRQDLYNDPKKRSALSQQLLAFRETLAKDASSWLLAKGEMRGSKRVRWRTHQYVLQGVGFNYDYADSEGPARDLRSGKPQERDSKAPTLPILRVHDLLVTTGMDGVFPPGLRVGTVSKINPLKEGDYTYELEAKPTAGNFDDLSLVFVLPPWGEGTLEKRD